jgi:hypothetical protein
MALIPMSQEWVRLLNAYQHELPDPPLQPVRDWLEGYAHVLARAAPGDIAAQNARFLLERTRLSLERFHALRQGRPVADLAAEVYELTSPLNEVAKRLSAPQFLACKTLDEVLVTGKAVLAGEEDPDTLGWPLEQAVAFAEARHGDGPGPWQEVLQCLDGLVDWLNGGPQDPAELLRALYKAGGRLTVADTSDLWELQFDLSTLRMLFGRPQLADAWRAAREHLPLRLEFRDDFLRAFDDAVETNNQEELKVLLTHGEPLLLPIRSARDRKNEELVGLLSGLWFEVVPDVTFYNYIETRLPAMPPRCLDAVEEYVTSGSRDALLVALETLLPA